MRRLIPALLALLAGPAQAQLLPAGAHSLSGRVEGKVYIAPGGTYRVAIPVLPELGGSVEDTPNVVTFQDAFNVHVSIGAFPLDATQRWELSTRGLKDYLGYFFQTFVLTDFQHLFPESRIESSRFLPDLMDGSLLTFTLLPGGSMFADKSNVFGPPDKPPVAKRGNLVFLRGGTLYIISTELAERVIEGTAYHQTEAQENEILRKRLSDLAGRIQFAGPASDK